VSTTGVVPACASVDCVSVFATSVRDASLVLAELAGLDPTDPWQRTDRDPLPPLPVGDTRIGVLDDAARDHLAPSVRVSYERLVALLAARCADVVPIDIGPFLEAGNMLYGDAFVAERWAAVGEFVAGSPDAVLDVTRMLIGAGAEWTAADYHRAVTRLRALRARTAVVWAGIDVLALPSVPAVPTLADDAADPIGTSATLGRFTTFTNLLDLAALTLPDPDHPAPGAGITLQAPANADTSLTSLATGLAGPALDDELASARTGSPPTPGSSAAPRRAEPRSPTGQRPPDELRSAPAEPRSPTGQRAPDELRSAPAEPRSPTGQRPPDELRSAPAEPRSPTR
jgi:allophanate hydrolase